MNKKTLLERTILLSKKNKFIDQTIVSTNCPIMHNIAKKYNCNSLKLRPEKLSGKYALTIDVIKHELKLHNIKDVFVLLLQVTSPFRNQNLTYKFLNKFKRNKNFSSSVSVTAYDHPPPIKAQVIKNNHLQSLMNKESMVPRQKLPKVYKLNGLFYLAQSKDIFNSNSFFNKHTLPFLVEKNLDLNLDDKNDLILLEFWKKKYLKINYLFN